MYVTFSRRNIKNIATLFEHQINLNKQINTTAMSPFTHSSSSLEPRAHYQFPPT